MRHVHFEKQKVMAWELVVGAWIFLDDRENPVMVERVEHSAGKSVTVTIAGAPRVTYGRMELVEVVS